MGLGDFLGDAPGELAHLPNAPKVREEGDDGRFKREERRPRRDDEREFSRSDTDDQWRRGGAGEARPPQQSNYGGGGGGFGGTFTVIDFSHFFCSLLRDRVGGAVTTMQLGI